MRRKKKGTVDLKSLWERAAGKAQKAAACASVLAPAPAPPPAPPSSLLQSLRFFLQQGLAFQGHGEMEDTAHQGQFPELVKWLAEHLEGADKAALQNALNDPHQMTSPNTLKGLVSACARETTRCVLRELGKENFAVLACLFSDARRNEQLAVCLRYVDMKGRVVERLIGIVGVENPDASTIKSAIESVLTEHSLSWSSVCGQGYDGVGNIRAHVKGLKKLITDESASAHYVHCFAQELQLPLVTVLEESDACAYFLEQLGFLVSLLKISCKKAQMLQVAEAQQVLEGLDPEKTFSKDDNPGRGFHYKTVLQIFILYPTIRNVLIMVGKDRTQGTEAVNAQKILVYFESFEFVFMTHLLSNVLGNTYILSRCFRIFRDHFMRNAIDLIDISKNQLDKLRRDDRWEKILKDVNSFCEKHGIKVLSMDDIYEPVLRSKKFFREVKNLHHYRVEIYTSILDRQIQEFDDRFDEVNRDFLSCVASFDPDKSFYNYDKDKLLKLAQFYPKDFSSKDLLNLPIYLTRFIADMRDDERFREVKSLVELSVMLVETRKNLKHFVVYKLLKLVLVLPVATANVERIFSAVDLVKNTLRNRVGEQLLYDFLLTFIEREVFMHVKDDALISHFQTIVGAKSHKECLDAELKQMGD